VQLDTNLPLYDRGLKFIPQGIGGYDENWYPVCLATEVARGSVKGFDFLDGRVVVFRSDAGVAQVLSPFCRHLGVDLAVGKVIGEHLRCAYHHWKYDQSGTCVATALGDAPPARARLFRFPTVESLGLIWAYNGEVPAYPAPHFSIDENELEIRTIRSVEVPMDPFMLYSNSLDLQHLISVHGIRFTETPKDFPIDSGRSISYTQKMVVPGLGESLQKVKLWGTNCIQLESDIANRPTFMMSAGLPVAGPVTRSFNVTATLKQVAKAGDEQMRDMHIKMVEQFGLQLNREDDPVMRTISPRLDNLTKSDHGLSVYFNFVRNYPRFSGATDMIRNDYRIAATPAGPQPQVLTDIIFNPSETGHRDE
jgi:phenylpropionate dioxygenase-like ring-hydroxylating dioxygenase large terminal subunit